MSTWDTAIFNKDVNVDFLDELASLDADERMEAVRDACLLAVDRDNASEDELLNGQAAATVAAIWAGAPFSAGDIADSYPFLRTTSAELDEKLVDAAVAILEDLAASDTEYDVDQFIEALS
ncbi:hypothetical protein KBP53_02760 [Corynebacterium genitalium ATCC 33030]|nr:MULTISPECIES: DUF4259 domain-containing protein [Corynebacterium]MCQ4619310.1 hypothetical protein [Corynebacterium pseudogenitalium]MCQ4620908.1 hypothetical protein [Corynebacterium sp. CCUG 71335]MCQ4623787.1 hypothetical protein [Corynebacterium sp. CCUG 70398]MCQ4624264.1 hypothetical protein [Corynebacterium sp. CCUG 69979]MCQ4627921.1 hypothetical protein [Corynebacterium sp. CCUG 65737]